MKEFFKWLSRALADRFTEMSQCRKKDDVDHSDSNYGLNLVIVIYLSHSGIM